MKNVNKLLCGALALSLAACSGSKSDSTPTSDLSTSSTGDALSSSSSSSEESSQLQEVLGMTGKGAAGLAALYASGKSAYYAIHGDSTTVLNGPAKEMVDSGKWINQKAIQPTARQTARALRATGRGFVFVHSKTTGALWNWLSSFRLTRATKDTPAAEVPAEAAAIVEAATAEAAPAVEEVKTMIDQAPQAEQPQAVEVLQEVVAAEQAVLENPTPENKGRLAKAWEKVKANKWVSGLTERSAKLMAKSKAITSKAWGLLKNGTLYVSGKVVKGSKATKEFFQKENVRANIKGAAFRTVNGALSVVFAIGAYQIAQDLFYSDEEGLTNADGSELEIE